jgi:RHS repeat-associated protein
MSYTFDRMGRCKGVSCNGISTADFFDLANDPLGETYSGGLLDGLATTNIYDSLLRRTSLTLLGAASSASPSTAYTYDAASRLSTVSDGTNSAAYFYVANSSLVDHIVFAHNGSTVMTAQNTYDKLNRLTGRSSVSSASSVVNFQYQYNTASQRTKVTLVDGSYWLYGYDALGQLTSAVKYFWDGTPYAGQQYGFTFDTIGNRTVALAGGDSNRMNLRTNIYSDNLLNQITSRTVPGYVDIMGLTLSTNVSVNGSNAYRKWEYFREQLSVSNSSNALWTNITVTNQTATNSGSIFVAQTPESIGYDLDGNLTNDGRFTYVWDGENRLTTMTSLSNAPTASKVSVAFTYDYMGRRIQKVVSTNNGTNWVVSYTNEFVYDGWNVAAILDGGNNLLYTFTWGTDLSGTMQGAGGVGGLLSITYCAPNAGTNAGTYFPCYDGNGNVVALVNAANGSFAGNWEYGPFGELIRATGPMAKLNPFMFSTKFYDWETGLYYYGYRYYNPSTGRWLSRDPMQEEAFVSNFNLYGDDEFAWARLVLTALQPPYNFIGNDANSHYDLLGLASVAITVTTVIRPPDFESGVKSTHSLTVDDKGNISGLVTNIGTTSIGIGSVQGSGSFSQSAHYYTPPPNVCAPLVRVEMSASVHSALLPSAMSIRYNYEIDLRFSDKHGSLDGKNETYPSYNVTVNGSTVWDSQQGVISGLLDLDPRPALATFTW